MGNAEHTTKVGGAVRPRTLGLLASIAGATGLLLYPLWLAGVVPGSDRIPPGLPEASHPLVVYLGVVGGSILLTWGVFTARHRTVASLTPRRSLLALPVALLGIAAGVVVFVAQWTGTVPLDLEGNPGAFDPSSLEIVLIEVTAVQFVALAAVSATFVGTVVARRGRRTAAASAGLPIAFLALGAAWGPQTLLSPAFIAVVALLAIPFAVGYAATRSQ